MAVEDKQPTGGVKQDGVAKRAYAIWENEGKPHGRDVDHWLQAEVEVGTAANIDRPSVPTTSSKAAGKTATRRK